MTIFTGIVLMRFFKLSLIAAVGLSACVATETSRKIDTPKPEYAAVQAAHSRVAVAIGNFNNKSNYQTGIFSDGEDRLGNQAQTVLIAHLNQSNRFSVLDRENMKAAKMEANIQKTSRSLKGADFLVTGDVTEFGRRVVGDKQLFGLLGRGKQQIAYSKVTLNVIKVRTSEVVVSVQGAGEYELSTREVLGFGGAASYDSTLNGKVLDLAIREAVDKLAAAADSGSF
jgi:curli biogenesis system outer membrane secretion channel CsgG